MGIGAPGALRLDVRNQFVVVGHRELDGVERQHQKKARDER
jgi:hypothetical protein